MMKHKPVMFGAVLLMVAMAMAQSQREREVLSVQGYQGQASVIRYQGRVFVDVQDLARITKGSLSFEEERGSQGLPISVTGCTNGILEGGCRERAVGTGLRHGLILIMQLHIKEGHQQCRQLYSATFARSRRNSTSTGEGGMTSGIRSQFRCCAPGTV